MAVCERCQCEIRNELASGPNPYRVYREKIIERSRVDDTNGLTLENGEWSPCRIWTGGVNSGGYGVIRANGKATYAHRVAYMAEYGPTDLQMNHQCDTKLCVNPRHMKAGTQIENMQEITDRRPWVRGSKRF